jgi:cytoskeletal protein RodZ
MSGHGLRPALATLLSAAALLSVGGCAAHRHWMNPGSAPIPASLSATASPTTGFRSPTGPADPRASASVASTSPSASPAPSGSASPASAGTAVASRPAQAAVPLPAPSAPARHHHVGAKGASGSHHHSNSGTSHSVGRHGPSPCDALAHEGGLPGNLYAQCRQVYG